MKILLAEDDLNISLIARLALEHFGHHQVTLASDGEMALSTALQESFHVIMLDEMMPKKNGLNVCNEYRSLKGPLASPIIFLSAKSQENDIAEFESQGLGYISKPFDPLSLCQQIESIMNRGKVQVP
jgi:DNA-binding response OmpR family regulator